MLKEIIQTPRRGGSATKYNYYNKEVREKHGNQAVSRSYWTLMLYYLIVEERPIKSNKTLYFRNSNRDFMHHAETGERLYSNDPDTETLCQEQITGNKCRVVVGFFAPSGLIVYVIDENDSDRNNIRGLGVARKF